MHSPLRLALSGMTECFAEKGHSKDDVILRSFFQFADALTVFYADIPDDFSHSPEIHNELDQDAVALFAHNPADSRTPNMETSAQTKSMSIARITTLCSKPSPTSTWLGVWII